MTKEQKKRRCTECKELFTPKRYGLKILKQCSKECIKLFADKEREKEFRRETKEMRDKMNDKSKSFWAEKVQKKCNEYIKLRDKNKPCISCGNTRDVKYDAGHYISVGASAALRYNVFNIHKQCSSYCNQHKSSNSIEYRKALVRLYGEEKVLWLEAHHEHPRRRIDDYKNLYDEFTQMIKQLKSTGD